MNTLLLLSLGAVQCEEVLKVSCTAVRKWIKPLRRIASAPLSRFKFQNL